jgi:phospholipase/lecithinase/hemolysin
VSFWLDQAGPAEVNAANVPTINGGRWIVNGSANYATNDGVHPTTAGHTLIAAGVDVSLFRAYG